MLRRLSPDAVRASLAAVEPWAPDLAPDSRYVPVADLVANGLVDRVCDRLGGAPVRVGQSTLVMGVASRLWSLTVVPAARDGVLVDLGSLVARDEHGTVVLGLRNPTGWADPAPDDVRGAVGEVLAPLVATFPLATRLLWGNVASSLHAVPRVHDLPGARALVDRMLEQPPYAGELDVSLGGRLRRRTCCLFYLVPGASLCGDCVFDEVPGD